MNLANRIICLTLTAVASATLARSQLIEFNDVPVTFQNGLWDSGRFDLPSDAIIGPNTDFTLILKLAGDLRATPFGTDGDAHVITRLVIEPGSEFVGVSLQLKENGINEGQPFGADIFDDNVNFPTQDISFDIFGGPVNVTFNTIDVTLFNNTQFNVVSSFETQLFVDPAISAVPEPRVTALFLSVSTMGLALILARRRSKGIGGGGAERSIDSEAIPS